ncbi:hypothetical protein DFJ74DRAFT_695862 [Hyaloraphidium curvatum]|nr:hypothetical protein DFJ74DRAFT_695862 [Hyaloraphidium curvatum]
MSSAVDQPSWLASGRSDSANAKHVDPATLPFHPIPAPASDDAVVKVSFLLNGRLKMDMRFFEQRPDKVEIEIPVHGALIEKRVGDHVQRIVWDPGCRSDPDNYPGPFKATMAIAFPSTMIGHDVATSLAAGGLSVNDIQTVVLSHVHFDHVGDPTIWPESAKMVVGDFTAFGPGYPEDNDSPMHAAELTKHKWTDLKTGGFKWQPVGAFDRAIDWFGDGSLFFCDAPGHLPGHLTALCRIKAGPEPEYILLGGDAAHRLCLYHGWKVHDGHSEDDRCRIGKYSFTATGLEYGPEQPLSVHLDDTQAYTTMAKLARMDAEDNVIVIVAHETELDGTLPMYPKDAHGWKEGKWKELRAKKLAEEKHE